MKARIEKIAVPDPDALRLSERNLIEDIVTSAQILLFVIPTKHFMIERFQPYKECHAFGLGQLLYQLAIMKGVLRHERSPTADSRMRTQQLCDPQHVNSIIRKVIVEEDDRRIPASKAENRAGGYSAVNRRRNCGDIVGGVCSYL